MTEATAAAAASLPDCLPYEFRYSYQPQSLCKAILFLKNKKDINVCIYILVYIYIDTDVKMYVCSR